MSAFELIVAAHHGSTCIITLPVTFDEPFFKSLRKQLRSPSSTVRACASGVVDSGLIPSRVTPMTLQSGIYSFLALRSALKEQCEKQADKFTYRAVEKGTERDSPILEW